MLLYFLRSVCTIQSGAINFQPFMPSFAIFHAFNDLFWELNDLEIEKHYKWTLKKLKLSMISSFHPHIMFKKVERITAKTGCTSFTNWTEEYGRLHVAMCSAVYTIPKGLKLINEHCTSFLFLITYYNFGLLLLWQKLVALRHFIFLNFGYNSRLLPSSFNHQLGMVYKNKWIENKKQKRKIAEKKNSRKEKNYSRKEKKLYKKLFRNK